MVQEQQLLTQFLKSLKIAATSKQLDLFSLLFVQKHLKKDEFFIREGSVNYNIAFLLKGVMRSYIVDEEGNETNLEFFQENRLFSGSYSFGVETLVNVQCLEDCTILLANGCDFITIVNSLNPVARSYNCILDSIYKKSVLQLTSYIKLNGKERYKLYLKDYPGLANRISLFHIANHLGISQVQLSRIRSEIAKSNNSDL